MSPQDAQKQLDELKKVADQLQYTIPQNWLDDPLANANAITAAFIAWDDELKEIKKDLSGLNSVLKANLQDLTKSNVQLNQARKATRDLTSISQTLMNDRKNTAILDTKQLEKLKQQTKISNDLLQQSIDSGKLKDEELEATRDNLRLGRDLLLITEERLELENKINQKMGMAPAIADGMGKVLRKIGFGGLADQLKLDDAVAKTKEFVKTNEGNVSSFETLKNFSGNIASNMGGMLTKANLIQASIGLLVSSMKEVDSMAGETAKTFGTSYKEAGKINEELTRVAATTHNIFINTKGLVDAQNQLNSALGTSAQLSGDSLANYTEITKQAGYSVETATTLFKLRQISGKTEKDLSQTYLGQVKALNLQNNLSVNGKVLLNEISNVSKGILATYSKNPEKLAQAAFEAKKLGINMKEVEGISNSLLDIESSIGAEYEAEVMTGKQLNLERARYYALTNDLAGVAKEINKQGIDSTAWIKMNAIQQEAMAKSMGMTKDQMGDMVMEASTLKKIGMADNEENKKKLAYLKEHGGNLESISELGKEEYDRQLKSVTTQEKFLALTEKLKEVFISMAEPVMAIVSPLVDLAAFVLTPIVEGFVGIKSIIDSIIDPTKSLAKTFADMGPVVAGIAGALTAAGIAVTVSLVPGLISAGIAAAAALPAMVGAAIAAISAASAATLGIGAIAIAGGIAASVAAMNSAKSTAKMDDGIVGPDGGMILSGKKGSIQLNKDDSVIAGTNLGGGGSEGGISTLASSLNNKMDQMIGRLDSLIIAVNKGMVVNLDGIKVSEGLATPMAISNRRI